MYIYTNTSHDKRILSDRVFAESLDVNEPGEA
jgi:hypothetical protein